VHSPVVSSFWHSHVGWIFQGRDVATDHAAVGDLSRYPELVWLNRFPNIPAIALAVVVLAAAGPSGLVVGFFWSTVALWHATFAINSLAHVYGRQRYVTGDQSRNNWWLALLTFGEGWHNNHHHYQSAARQGFRWYEVDVSYYALRALSLLKLVSNLKLPPRPVVRNEQRLGKAVIERAARQLATSFQSDQLAARLRSVLSSRTSEIDLSLDEVQERIAALPRRLGAKAPARSCMPSARISASTSSRTSSSRCQRRRTSACGRRTCSRGPRRSTRSSHGRAS